MGQLQGLRIEGTRTRQDYKGCKGYRLVRKGWGCWGGGGAGGEEGRHTWEAKVQCNIQAADIHTQLQSIGGGHRPQITIMQGCLNLSPLL